jgi:hypothetical protein
MGRSYGKYIRGDCFNTIQRNSGPLLRTLTAHTVMGSFTCGQPTQSTITGCNGNAFFPADTDKQFIPQQYIFGNSLVLARFYGDKTPLVNLTDIDGNPVFFTQATVNTLKPRQLCPPLYNRTFAQGPSISNSHLFASMPRKFNYDNEYVDRLNYEWTDALVQMPIAPYDEQICGPGCTIRDWLAVLHPATSLYTSIPEPFKITTHYEQSGSPVPNNPIYYANNYLPFCTPIPVKKADGTAFGNYTGYSTVMIFGESRHVFPAKPYLPPDPYNNEMPPKQINPAAVIYSMEVWWFFVADNPLLGSPLLSKIRYYYYSTNPSTPLYYTPFQIMFSQTGIPSSFDFGVNFNVLNKPCPELITLNLSNLRILVTV